jgi:hypothetical protein
VRWLFGVGGSEEVAGQTRTRLDGGAIWGGGGAGGRAVGSDEASAAADAVGERAEDRDDVDGVGETASRRPSRAALPREAAGLPGHPTRPGLELRLPPSAPTQPHWAAFSPDPLTTSVAVRPRARLLIRLHAMN